MQKSTGIVLQAFHGSTNKGIILDNNLGKITISLHTKNSQQALHHGYLLNYYLQPFSTILYTITSLEIEFIPFDLAQKNIYFLHHVLELYYYFLPFHVPSPLLFNLLLAIMQTPHLNEHLALMQFFGFLGVYPEDLPLEKNYFLHLLSAPFETILKEKLDAQQCKMIECWLLQCIAMHPHNKYFKTNYWLTKKLL